MTYDLIMISKKNPWDLLHREILLHVLQNLMLFCRIEWRMHACQKDFRMLWVVFEKGVKKYDEYSL